MWVEAMQELDTFSMMLKEARAGWRKMKSWLLRGNR